VRSVLVQLFYEEEGVTGGKCAFPSKALVSYLQWRNRTGIYLYDSVEKLSKSQAKFFSSHFHHLIINFLPSGIITTVTNPGHSQIDFIPISQT
jgi:hypothetical protein